MRHAPPSGSWRHEYGESDCGAAAHPRVWRQGAALAGLVGVCRVAGVLGGGGAPRLDQPRFYRVALGNCGAAQTVACFRATVGTLVGECAPSRYRLGAGYAAWYRHRPVNWLVADRARHVAAAGLGAVSRAEDCAAAALSGVVRHRRGFKGGDDSDRHAVPDGDCDVCGGR